MVIDGKTGKEEEPNAGEREESLGYELGDTAAPGLSERDRRAILGRCMDANVSAVPAGHSGSMASTALLATDATPLGS
jgi:hypothetical protein